MWRNATGFLLAALAACPLRAEELNPTSPLSESLGDKAQISGNIVAGFMSVGQQAEHKPHIEALVPRAWGGSDVCLTLVSQDGRYEAYGEYAVPANWAGGVVSVPIQSRYNDYLRSTDRDHFAAMLSQGHCDARGAVVTPLSWNEEVPGSPSDYVLLVNSYAADEVYVILADGADVDCHKTGAANHVAFDFTCPIPESGLAEGAEIQINRIRSGRSDRPHFIEVVPAR
ncbi:hypothetical protein [Marinibacterium sp. SX1]|uniref:hypothetical protein n=1 Tax=Marinibacterium sp. SX1 TaxID=3388424 RepID=UPI003D17EF92